MGSTKKSVGRPKGTGTGQARELTPDEVERLYKCTLGPRDRALLAVCLGAGLRAGEAVSLLRSHVGDGWVLVERSRAKSGKSRRCRLTPAARRHLAAWLKTAPAAAPESPLFPSRSGGGCMHPGWAIRLIDGLLSAAGIAGATSHSLRRTHANALRREGIDLTIVQLQLGHSSLATTAIYMRAEQPEHAAALDRIRGV